MLTQFPYEFYAQLNLEDMLHFAQVNKEANQVSSNTLFWNPHYQRYRGENVKTDKPKQVLHLGLSKERQVFSQYLTALSCKLHEVKEKNKLSHVTESEKETLAYYYINTSTQVYESFLNQGSDYLENVIESSGLSYPEIESLQRYFTKIFNDAISGKLSSNKKDNSQMNTLFYVLDTLAQIDASIAMRMLLDKIDLTKIDYCIHSLFHYPSPKVLKMILDAKPEIVKELSVETSFSNLECTPLMIAILGATNFGKIKESNEIFNLLIERGAETNFCVRSPNPAVPITTRFAFEDFCQIQKYSYLREDKFTDKQKKEISRMLDALSSMKSSPSQTMGL